MNRNLSSILFGTNSVELSVRDNIAIPANTPGLMAMVSDGTNSRYLKADSTGRPIVAEINTTASANISSATSLSIALEGKQSVGFFKSATAMNGILTPELSFDGGTTWVATFLYDPTSGLVSSTVAMVFSAALSRNILIVGGATHARIRVSTYTSGSSDFTIMAMSTPHQGVLFASLPGSSAPVQAIQIGASDGTGMRVPRLYDLDSTGTTEYVLGVSLRKGMAGATVELGTSSDPIFVSLGSWLGSTAPTVGQKTGANSLPVVVASDNILTSVVRGGAKGATTAADLTSTAEGADHQALDVQIYHGGTAVNPTAIRALTSSDVVTAAQGAAAAAAGAWFIRVTDGTNTAAVKAASTAPATTDPALVVALSPNAPAFVTSSTPSQSSVAGSASSVQLLAANTSRRGATIFNDSTAVMFLKLGTTASNTSFTARMAANSYYEVPFGYTGRIDGIWASATGNARITELT